jgi:hypothetical protein
MAILKKLLKRAGAVVVVVVLYFLGIAIWASIPPRRPANVSRSAVFLFGLPVGAPFPTPKRGTWVDCWLDTSDSNRCRAIDADGTPIYEGPYIRFEGTGLVPQSEIQINTRASTDFFVIQGVLIPIIHLRDGTILIPAKDADEARRQALDWLRQNPNR